jgi:hypothetical protein
MMHKSNDFFKVTLPYTLKAKITIRLLTGIYALVGLWKGRKWKLPKQNFEENPREGGLLGALYLGYKYYYRPHRKAEKGIEKYFKNQDLNFKTLTDEDIDKTITMTVGGDLMPYEWINRQSCQHLWDEVGHWFFDADLVIANLETPIDISKPANCVPELMLSDMYFNGSDEIFDVFNAFSKYKGYDLLSTANNHSMDMGEDGLVATMHYLEEKKVAYVGTSLTKEAQQRPVILERQGIKFAFLSWTANLNQCLAPDDKPFMVNYLRLNVPDVDVSSLVEQAKAARKAGADIIVTMLHVGNAYQVFPSAHTQANFHKIFDATGTDLILGYHPHNAQPMEKYSFNDPFTGEAKNGFAIYSTADFIAYDIFVWDRMIPLLKLHFQSSKRTQKVSLQQIELQATYMFGTKSPKNNIPELRMLPLLPLCDALRNGNVPIFLDPISVQEVLHLEWFLKRYFLPNNTSPLILK